MADEQIGLGVGIKSTSDNTGFDTAARGAKDTEGALKGAGSAAETATTSFKELAGALGLLVGLSEVISFLKDSTEEFYKNEKAVRGVGLAAQAYGKDVAGVKKEVQEWADAMGRLSGVSNNELTRAVGEQFMLTGNLTDAYHTVSLAMDYATAKGVSFGEGMTLVTSVIHGKTRALIGAIPEVTRHTAASQAQAMGQKYLETTIRGATTAVHDGALEADKAKERWDQFKESIGGGVSKVIVGMRDALLSIPAGLRSMGAAFSTVWAEISERGSVVATFLETMWKGPAAAYKKYQEGMALASVHSQQQMVVAQAAAVAGEKKKQDELTKLAALGAGGRLHLDDLRAKDSKALLDTTVSYDLKSYYAMLAAEEAAYKKHSAFMKQEMQKVYLESKKYLDDAENAEEHMQQKVRELVKQTLAVKKAAAKKELEMQVMVANEGVALLGEVFGASKELSIAQAIINTYEGATKALAQGGIYGAVLAALVIADGLAQIVTIESTNPQSTAISTTGGGFDDPSNDRSAYLGGRRWAKDMIDNFSSGVSQGWSAGMGAGGSTTNNSATTNINVAGGLIDPNSREWMKQFGRKLNIVMQSDGQRTVTRRT